MDKDWLRSLIMMRKKKEKRRERDHNIVLDLLKAHERAVTNIVSNIR